jgi:hypothetical protein
MVNQIDALIGVFIMTIFIHMMTRPVKGIGIAVPALLPPIMAAGLALVIGSSHYRPTPQFNYRTLNERRLSVSHAKRETVAFVRRFENISTISPL